MTKSKYPNIKNIKAEDLKDLGFKSKAIAMKFAKILNINIKKASSEESFLNELKTKLNGFKSIGLDFNSTLKTLDLSSQKVKENRRKKEIKKNETKFNEVASKINERIDPFKIVIRGEHVRYLTKNEPTDITLKKSSDHYLRFTDFKFPAHKDYIPIEKTEHAWKKTFYLPFDYDIYNKNLTQFKNDLYNIYNQQKYTFKITFEFSFLLVLAEGYREISDETKSKLESKYNKYNYQLEYELFYASTNTRLKGFENPVVVDNKKDIETIIKKIESKDLIEALTESRAVSQFKFYKFLGVKFHVYEMNTPIGKINELPIHFKQGSNEKALIKFENHNDYLCFWRCFSYHI